MSAVRFCPWPHFLSLEFNQLQALRSRLSSIEAAHFEVTFAVSVCCWSNVELIELVWGLRSTSSLRDSVPPVNSLGLVAHHFHGRAAWNTGAFQVSNCGPAEAMGNAMRHSLNEFPILIRDTRSKPSAGWKGLRTCRGDSG